MTIDIVQLAREAGFVSGFAINELTPKLQAFANAVLEAAAVKCDGWFGADGYDCAESIRWMKQ